MRRNLFLFAICFAFQVSCTGNVAPAPLPKAEAPLALGKKLYGSKMCISCHTMNGSPAAGPTFKGLYGKTIELRDGTKVLADDAYIKESIKEPGAKVSKGFPSIMPKLNLTDEEIEALTAFIRSLREKEKVSQN